jgi:protein-disulfide isomerase-like protein with CxxC motif
MTEGIDFYFDPLCPWAWRTSKWVRELERAEIVSVDWRFFSLSVINEGSEDVLDDPDNAGSTGLRSLALVKTRDGNEKTGELYLAMGERSHEVPRRLTIDLVRTALGDAGLPPELLEDAMGNAECKDHVLRDHRVAVDRVGAFGVPTIVLESGKGIFGPVIEDEGASEPAEMWNHVRWLIEKDGFFELKRERR